METEEAGTSTGRTKQGPGELIEDPELLKQLVEDIPGSQSQGDDKKSDKKVELEGVLLMHLEIFISCFYFNQFF